MSERKHFLKMHGVSKNYWDGKKELQVLKGVTTTFEQGSTYAITGASGSGKSTLLHILGGLDEPTSGSILFNQEPLSDLKNKNIFLNQQLGFVFQFHYLIHELTVLENIMMIGVIKGDSVQVCKEKALKLLSQLGIHDKANNYPDQLSGGQQQRVSIGRALFNKPTFLLADEPTGNLDANNAHNLVELLLQARQQWGMAIILCSHDKNVFSRMDNILQLHDGVLG
jgi:ABC-type lipoprotein export system ATPase subunit